MDEEENKGEDIEYRVRVSHEGPSNISKMQVYDRRP